MKHFGSVAALGARVLPAGTHATRTVHFSLLAKYQER
jgi:hypothetical protein